jgi:branched-chain amino acid transport system substrate-binding protein
VLEARAAAPPGLHTTLHYADGIETPRNKAFRAAYSKAHNSEPDVYAVQGYDTGLLLAAGLEVVRGDASKKKELITALEKARIDSPRGAWTLSKAHNPIQDIYLRKVVGKENKVVSVAHKALEDPAQGCNMKKT